MNHRDIAETQLDFADPQITGSADALLRSAQTHALIYLADVLSEISCVVAVPHA